MSLSCCLSHGPKPSSVCTGSMATPSASSDGATSNTKPYACSYCTRSFTRMEHLQRHHMLRKPTSPPPYKSVLILDTFRHRRKELSLRMWSSLCALVIIPRTRTVFSRVFEANTMLAMCSLAMSKFVAKRATVMMSTRSCSLRREPVSNGPVIDAHG